jgi:heme-degrading monooxygenase HmoA
VTIERVWSARTTHDKLAAYAEYFRRVVIPELAAVAGYRGHRLLQRRLASDTVSGAGPEVQAIEIVVVTEWESLDVIRGFAGDDVDRAVVHDEAAVLFTDYDDTVRHYEVVTRS